jgi:hypothetical protein
MGLSRVDNDKVEKYVKVGAIYSWDAGMLLKGRSLTFHEGSEHLKHTSIK